MPTAAQLISQIADESGLDATIDLAAIVRALNRATRRINAIARPLVASTDVSGLTGTSLVVPATIAQIRNVYCATLSTGPWNELDQSTLDAVQEAQSTGGTPLQYAIIQNGAAMTMLTDGPVDNCFIRFYGVLYPTTLVGTETETALIAATGIPLLFHEDLLANLALVNILEGYEGDEQRAAYYRSLGDTAMKDYRHWLSVRGGDEAQNSRAGASHFTTPNPLTNR